MLIEFPERGICGSPARLWNFPQSFRFEPAPAGGSGGSAEDRADGLKESIEKAQRIAGTKTQSKDMTMWYFSWILGLGLACFFSILNAMWFELREGESHNPRNPGAFTDHSG